MEHPIDPLPRWKKFPAHAIRVFFALARDLAEGDLTLYASSLSYTTLLSIVPFFAVSFWFFSLFGVHHQMSPILSQWLAPMGASGAQVTAQLVNFVEKIDFNILGFVGAAMLFYTVLSLMIKIEAAFNFIWQVRRHRRFLHRAAIYIGAILIGPALIFTALGIMASILNTAISHSLAALLPIGDFMHWASRGTHITLIATAFSLMIWIIPNTSIKLSSAILGGLLSGLLWESTGWLFASFVVTSSNYAAIYSTFASLVLFLIWLYLGWLILLIGAGIAFYHQNPSLLRFRHRRVELSTRTQENIALIVLHLVGTHYFEQQKPWTLNRLSHQFNLPKPALQCILDALVKANILVEWNDKGADTLLLPAHEFKKIGIRALFEAIGGRPSDSGDFPAMQPAFVKTLLQQRDQTLGTLLDRYRLSDLLDQTPAPDRPQ